MKTTEPRPQTEAAMPCFDCATGSLKRELRDNALQHPTLGEITIPNVPMFVCDTCGELVIGDEGSRLIDTFLDQALNVISLEDIHRFLDKYHLTQKEASRITGLGEKNISRWASGKSRPSESVSNFLRLLLADEAAFERVRQKNFSARQAASSLPLEEKAPDQEEMEVLKQVDYPKLVEIGIVAPTRKPTEKRTQLCRWSKSVDLLDFRRKMESREPDLAAFKDTRQRSNPVSAGLWVSLGESAASKIETSPYSREKLRKAVKELRNLTRHSLSETAPDVQAILAKAGVALVFVPIMKESAMRGCTKLLTHNKAVIIHGLKYRSLSQFWVILFHEIAHLLLHISEPGQAIPDYEEASDDPREVEADKWAFDTLASLDAELEFLANHPKPQPWQLEKYAGQIRIHPAIAAEVLNRRAGKEVISFAFLKKKGLFPHLSGEETRVLMETSNPR